MKDKEKNGWIKFVQSLDLPKERVSIAYDTHDERGIRYAYGYFQFYNGTCGCFWKDGNEQPKVVKAEDIKYWMPVPSLDVQEEPVSEDLEEAAKRYATEGDEISGLYIIDEEVDAFIAGAKWQKQQILDCNTTLQRTFELGKQEMKQQMMAKAIDGHVGQTINGMLRALSDETYGDMGFTAGDKVKLIIIKED